MLLEGRRGSFGPNSEDLMSGFHVDIFSSNSASYNGGSSARRKLRYQGRQELPINRKSTS